MGSPVGHDLGLGRNLLGVEDDWVPGRGSDDR